MWIARDKDGELMMYEREPIYQDGLWVNQDNLCYNLGYNCLMFEGVLPGMKVEFTMKKENHSSDILKEISKSLKELNQTMKRIEKKK